MLQSIVLSKWNNYTLVTLIIVVLPRPGTEATTLSDSTWKSLNLSSPYIFCGPDYSH